MCLLRRRRRCGVRLDTRNVKPFKKRSLHRPRPSVRPSVVRPSVPGPDRGEPESGVSPFQSKAAAVNRRLDQTTKWIEEDWLGRKELGIRSGFRLGRREVVLNLETEQFGQITDTGISLMSQSEEPSDSALTDRRNERERTDGRSSGSFKPLSVRPFGHFIPSTVGRTATHRRRLLLQLQQRGRGVRRPH